jgi:hypothetical protein
MIGGGALGPQASNAIRHVAAQNGVWSLGNFGGVPPKSAMTYYQGTQGFVSETPQSQDAVVPLSANVEEHDYRFVFNSSPVGMVRVFSFCIVPDVFFLNLLTLPTGNCFHGWSFYRLQQPVLPVVELY